MIVAGVEQDIESYLIDHLGPVKRAPGFERRANCPWCGDQKGHLYVNVDPNADIPGLFLCFKCGEKGALNRILRYFGDEPPRPEKDSYEDRFILHDIWQSATDYYSEQLGDPDVPGSVEAAMWLVDSRGLSPETIAARRLGYATDGLSKHLRGVGFSLKAIQQTGLVDSAGRDFFTAGQVTIPYISGGSTVLIRAKQIGGKYLTPPGQKSRLYNSDITFRAPENETIVVTEGEFDCMVLDQIGYHSVSVPGAQNWQPHWTTYFSDTKKLYVVFDNDEAGRAGAERVKNEMGPRARIVTMPPAGEGEKKNDPTEWIVVKGHTEADFQKLLDKTDRSAGPFRKASTFSPKKVRFFWGERIPLGKITILSGIGGKGKSFLTMALAAAVTRGDHLPDDRGQTLDGEVVMLSYEDDIEDTIVPRAIAMGADLDRLHLLPSNIETVTGGLRPFGPRDVDAYIKEPLLENPNIKLVIIDPLGSFYPPNTDSSAETAVRGALKSIADAAAMTGAAVLIVAHNKKGNAGNALHQISGSQAVGAFARSTLSLGSWNGRAMVAHAKSNLAPLADTLAFSVDDGVFSWGGLVTGVNADDLADPSSVKGGASRERIVTQPTSNYMPAAAVKSLEDFKLAVNQSGNQAITQGKSSQEITEEIWRLKPDATYDDLISILEWCKGHGRHPTTLEGLIALEKLAKRHRGRG